MTDFVQNTLSIRLIPRRSWFALGPGWAVVGSLLAALSASNGFSNLSQFVPIIILWLLVDPALGTIWQLTVNDGLLQNLGQKAQADNSLIKPILPYTGQNSLGYRISVGVSYLRAQNDGVWQTLLLLSLLALILSAFLGWLILIYSLLCLSLALIVAGWAATQARRQFLQTLFLFTLPFVAGLYLLNSLNWTLAGLGILYSLIYWGVLRLGAGQYTGIRLIIVSQAVVTLFLFAHKQPLGAYVVALATIFSLLLRNQALKSEPVAWNRYLIHLHPLLLFGFLAAALFLETGG